VNVPGNIFTACEGKKQTLSAFRERTKKTATALGTSNLGGGRAKAGEGGGGLLGL
jgi:hypothetical protein